MANDQKNVRRRILYAGNVQGVGFRATTSRVAQTFAVTGLVRNLANGKVELVVEGEAAEIELFLAEVARRLGNYIDDSTVTQETPTGEFRGFGISQP